MWAFSGQSRRIIGGICMTKKNKMQTAFVWSTAVAIILGYSFSNIGEITVFSYEKQITTQEDLSEKYPTEWGEDSVFITLEGEEAQIDGKGAQWEDQTLKIETAGTYVISGQISDGQILIDAEKEDEVHLVLNGAEIHCEDQAAIYAKQCDRLILTLAEGSINKISDGEVYTFEDGEDEPDGVIFSKDDLIINGTGELEAEGNYGHGIVSKDDLILVSGTIKVTSVKDGIKGKDSVTAENPNVTIISGEDGIRSNNDSDSEKGTILLKNGIYTITSEQDGIQAETSLEILGGTYEITTGGGSENGTKSKNTFSDGMMERPNFDDLKIATPSDARPNFGKMPFKEGMTPPEGDFVEKPEGEWTAPPERDFIEKEYTAADAVSETNQETEVSKKGIKSGTQLIISGGNFMLNTADDSIHTNGDATILDGTFEISSGDDGIHADEILTIEEGILNIVDSYEGLEGSKVEISGGEITVLSSDDGINAAGGSDSSEQFPQDFFQGDENYEILISGGNVSINASGDGMDSNGNLEITGGIVLVNGSVSGGEGALDYGLEATMTGGVLVAAGSSGMVQGLSSDSEVPSIMLYFNEIQEEQTRITILDEEGNVILSFVPQKQFESIVLSSEKLEEGKTYTLMSGGTIAGNDTDFGEDGILEGGEEITQVTINQMTTSISEDGTERQGFGGMKGMPGQGKKF